MWIFSMAVFQCSIVVEQLMLQNLIKICGAYIYLLLKTVVIPSETNTHLSSLVCIRSLQAMSICPEVQNKWNF